MLTRKKLLIFIGVLAVFCLLSFCAKTGTAAWFVSETTATGSIVNAKTADLVDVTSEVTSCANDGFIQAKVYVTNKHKAMIPIHLGDVEKNVQPGETVSVHISEQVFEKTTRLSIPFKGYENYIDEEIRIPLEPECAEVAGESANLTSGQDDTEKSVEKETAKDKTKESEDQNPAVGESENTVNQEPLKDESKKNEADNSVRDESVKIGGKEDQKENNNDEQEKNKESENMTDDAETTVEKTGNDTIDDLQERAK